VKFEGRFKGIVAKTCEPLPSCGIMKTQERLRLLQNNSCNTTVTGEIIYESLVKPVYHRLPPSSKHQRFDHQAFSSAPYWTDIWPSISELINNKLLVAYNANFERACSGSDGGS
jgi:DNA polymerase III epsilon subunit-like protein